MRVYEALLSDEETLFEVPFQALDSAPRVVKYMRDINGRYPCNEVFEALTRIAKTSRWGATS